MRRGWHTGKKAGVASDEEIKCTKSGRSIIWRHSVSSDMMQLWKVCVDKVEKVRRRLTRVHLHVQHVRLHTWNASCKVNLGVKSHGQVSPCQSPHTNDSMEDRLA